MGLISLRLANIIDAALAEVAGGTSLFNDWMPDKPDLAVCVNELPGLPPQLAFEGQPVTSEASVQVKVRASGDSSAVAARTLAWKVHRVLWELADVPGPTVDDPNILVCNPRHDPVFLERDDTDRVVYVANYFVSASWRS